MELKLYLRMLQRSWWVIALTALSALNIALLASFMATPLYRTSARFIVSPSDAVGSERDIVNSLGTLDKRSIVSTYAEILNSSRIFRETGAELQIAPGDLSNYTHSTVVLADANVLQLSVEGPDPDTTALLANAIGRRSIDYAKGLNQVFDINFLDPAVSPSKPFSPQPLRDVSIALALGLVLGSVLAIANEQIRAPLEALRRRTMIDGVSSAYNRRYFQQLLEEEIVRDSQGVVSLGLVQLDGLQDLLEKLPPLVVQQLMKNVTRILRNELRGNDSVGRWGDLTFAVLLPATPNMAAARTLERIQQALSAPMQIENDRIDLNPHIGAGTSQGNQSAAMLILQAETMLEKDRQANAQTAIFVDSLKTRPAQYTEKVS